MLYSKSKYLNLIGIAENLHQHDAGHRVAVLF